MSTRPFVLAAVLVAAGAALAGAAAATHFTVTATYVAPAKAGADGAIAVTLTPLDPDIHVNEEPSPRLKLDPAQIVLVDKQTPPPARTPVFDAESARYLDPKVPVSFAVAVAPKAPKGMQSVKATVTYFYCSKREGWCRKGSADVEVPVKVP
jgi:hypothetical protein